MKHLMTAILLSLIIISVTAAGTTKAMADSLGGSDAKAGITVTGISYDPVTGRTHLCNRDRCGNTFMKCIVGSAIGSIVLFGKDGPPIAEFVFQSKSQCSDTMELLNEASEDSPVRIMLSLKNKKVVESKQLKKKPAKESCSLRNSNATIEALEQSVDDIIAIGDIDDKKDEEDAERNS